MKRAGAGAGCVSQRYGSKDPGSVQKCHGFGTLIVTIALSVIPVRWGSFSIESFVFVLLQQQQNLWKHHSRGFSFLISMLNREDSRYGSCLVHSQQQEKVTRAVRDNGTVNIDSAQTPTESSRTRGAAAEESQVVGEISVTFYRIYWAVIFSAH